MQQYHPSVQDSGHWSAQPWHWRRVYLFQFTTMHNTQVWIIVGKHQMKDTMILKILTYISVNQYLFPSLSATIHPSCSLLNSLPQCSLVTVHVCLLLPLPFCHQWFLQQRMLVFPLSKSPTRTSEWHLFHRVFLDPPARSNHYLF